MYDDDQEDVFCDREYLREQAEKPDVSEVFRAVTSGDHEKLSELLEARVSVETQNSFGLTPLQVACFRKNHKAVEMLIKAGCNVDARGGCSGKSPLSLAAFAGDVYIFETLINHKASPVLTDNFGSTILHDAVLGGHASMVEHILKTIPSPLHESANRAGRTPQHLAAFLGSASEVVDALTKGRGETQLRDANGRSVRDLADAHAQEADAVEDGAGAHSASSAAEQDGGGSKSVTEGGGGGSGIGGGSGGGGAGGGTGASTIDVRSSGPSRSGDISTKSK